MKAPDKIYVEVCEDGIFAFPEPPFKESVEYIRADLIEQPLQPKQPVEGLEEEIERFYRTDEYRIADTLGRGFETLARHFTEWGADHLRSVTKMGAQHMLTSAREWWKARLRGFVGDGIAEGMVNEFCEDMEENYE